MKGSWDEGWLGRGKAGKWEGWEEGCLKEGWLGFGMKDGWES